MKKLLLLLLLALAPPVWGQDSKLTELDELPDPDGDTLVYCVADPSGTPTSKKCKVSSILAAGDITVNEAADYSWTGQHTFADTIGTLTSAGAFGAGTCTTSGFHGVDTTNEIPYYCSDGQGGNPRAVTTLGDGYTGITAESGSSTASGASTLNVTCTPNCTTTSADASPDTLVITISNHVRSAYFPANALTTDGTQCANPALATINSGPRIWTILCADNDGSTVYGHTVMPDSWDGGDVTFELEAVQTANDTGVLNSDIAAMCRGAGETINNTWGTEVAMDDAAVGGNSIVDHTTSAAVTANGTCAAGDTLFFRWQIDAGGTTVGTISTTYHILGFKMEYTVSGAGSD